MTVQILHDVLEATGYLADGRPEHGVYLGEETDGRHRTRGFLPGRRLAQRIGTVRLLQIRHRKFRPTNRWPDGTGKSGTGVSHRFCG